MIGKPFRTPPAYAIASVDHALRIATMLQLEGSLTVSEVAERLGVARSTAHRLLAMLVYRDFAVRDESHAYQAGPVLELAAHSQSQTSRLRAAALPHLRRLVDAFDETASLTIRTGRTARFLATVECGRSLRVGSREGMVFPAHLTTAGLLLLAELSPAELDAFCAGAGAGPGTVTGAGAGTGPGAGPGAGAGTDGADRSGGQDLDPAALRAELAHIRRAGFALNKERSERGVVAVGVPVRAPGGAPLAGLSVSMPSVRYDRGRLPSLVATLKAGAQALEADLAPGR